jgi:hypothetical protein
LTKRLSIVAYKYISAAQTAFIPGRQILDGVVVLHEILDGLRRSKAPRVIIKLDFEKAYDKIY